MKQITMMSGKEIIISDEEATNIGKVIEAGRAGLIQLRDGSLINLSSVETISEIDKEPYFMGNPMNKSMTKVFVGGDWKMFSGSKKDIEFKQKKGYAYIDGTEENKLLKLNS